jgi:ABC-type nitrate/sulfonate/bicarbonate transport system substrate-binding protein
VPQHSIHISRRHAERPTDTITAAEGESLMARTEGGQMPDPVDRRAFLRTGGRFLGGAALLGVAGPLLEACGSSSKSTSTATTTATTAAGAATTVAPGTYGALAFNLPWVPDVESGGEFLAQSKGYYTQQGFSSVNLIPAGPTATPQETVVETGKALVGVSSLDSTAAAVQKGFTLKVIGTEYQKNPFCIMSLASKPLNTPQDMIGKKIGVQSVNDAVWAAFLKANNIQLSQVKKVVVSFDPTPLSQGQVDGWFSFITNEPIELGLKGVPTHSFLLADYNYPEIGNVFITTADSLANSRAKVKACMLAEIIAWRECIATPNAPAQVTIQNYGQGLTLAAEQQQSVAQNKLMATGDALTNGLFYVTPTTQDSNIKTLALGGTTVTAGQLFDMTLLDEIYQARADLKPVPAQGTIA